MDYRGIREDVAQGSRSPTVESEELSNPDLWIQRKRDGDVWQDLVGSYSTACTDIGRRISGRPRSESEEVKVKTAIATKMEQTARRCDTTTPNLYLPFAWRYCRETCMKKPAIQEAKAYSSQAMAYSAGRTSKSIQHVHSIYVSTFAILFLGTPHDGGNKAKLASTSRRMIGALVPSKIVDTEGQLLDALQEGSEVLQNITDIFVPLMKDFRIFFFWEQEKTDMGLTQDYVRQCSSLGKRRLMLMFGRSSKSPPQHQF